MRAVDGDMVLETVVANVMQQLLEARTCATARCPKVSSLSSVVVPLADVPADDAGGGRRW
jgi:hypothetical protein